MRWMLMMTLLVSLAFVGAGILGCGEEERLCRNDHDCDGEEVCEPNGCRRGCETELDCPGGQRCELRRVEPGRVCRS